MVLTIAMTAAPAPASAHTNRWKVKSSCNTQCTFRFSWSHLHSTLNARLQPATFLCLPILPHWIRTSWRTSQILCRPSSPQIWSQLLKNSMAKSSFLCFSITYILQEERRMSKEPLNITGWSPDRLFVCIYLKETVTNPLLLLPIMHHTAFKRLPHISAVSYCHIQHLHAIIGWVTGGKLHFGQ